MLFAGGGPWSRFAPTCSRERRHSSPAGAPGSGARWPCAWPGWGPRWRWSAAGRSRCRKSPIGSARRADGRPRRPATCGILSIATTYAETGSAFVLPSAAAKAGVLAMTRSLAVEWAVYGIRLNAVAPGPFPTEGAFSRLLTGEMEEQARRRIPSRRFGEHEELTNLVAFLMSDASPYLTGDLVTIDGGEALFSGQEFAGLAHLDRTKAKELMAALKPKKK